MTHSYKSGQFKLFKVVCLEPLLILKITMRVEELVFQLPIFHIQAISEFCLLLVKNPGNSVTHSPHCKIRTFVSYRPHRDCLNIKEEGTVLC